MNEAIRTTRANAACLRSLIQLVVGSNSIIIKDMTRVAPRNQIGNKTLGAIKQQLLFDAARSYGKVG